MRKINAMSLPARIMGPVHDPSTQSRYGILAAGITLALVAQ